MVRKKSEQEIEYKNIRGGIGEVRMEKILNNVDELFGKGRMFNRMIVPPGNTLGEHYHTGDNEIFYVLSGSGEYNDNGTIVKLEAGDTAVCRDGEMHGLKNTGDVPIEMIALILYS